MSGKNGLILSLPLNVKGILQSFNSRASRVRLGRLYPGWAGKSLAESPPVHLLVLGFYHPPVRFGVSNAGLWLLDFLKSLLPNVKQEKTNDPRKKHNTSGYC
jgi:hypothetical protein